MASARQPVVFITGANRGIGCEIVKRLAAPPWNCRVFMGSRSLAKGESARGELIKAGCKDITVVQIDLDDKSSIADAAVEVQKALGAGEGLDVLINNAAFVNYDFSVDVVKQSIQTNYRGTVAVTEAFAPMVINGGRIIFVSSAVGKTYLVDDAMAAQLLAEDLTAETLDASMQALEHSVNQGSYIPPTDSIGAVAYGLGKLGGTTIYPRIISRRLQDSHFVAACCPAFGGADTPVWLATAAEDKIRGGHGGFWEQRELTDVSDWQAGMRCTLARTGCYPPGCE